MRLFEIHDQAWFPQFLRDEFVDGLQMILDVTNTYQPIAKLLRKRLEESGAERVLDLCSVQADPGHPSCAISKSVERSHPKFS